MATAAKTTKTAKSTAGSIQPPATALLGVIEALLASPLKDALGKSAEVLSGPLLPPATGALPRVAVVARSLASQPGASEQDPHEAREPVFFSQRFILAADPRTPLDFPLPIRFYAPPAGKVGVQMRGARARGYVEKTTCRIELEIETWAQDVPTCDTLTATAVAATLKIFAGMDTLDFTPYEASDFVLRILKPLARLTAMERGAAQVAGTDWAHATAHIVLSGELELNLVLGTPAAEGVIQHIAYTLK